MDGTRTRWMGRTRPPPQPLNPPSIEKNVLESRPRLGLILHVLYFIRQPSPSYMYRAPRLVGVTSDFTNFNKVSISSRVEDLAGDSPFAILSIFSGFEDPRTGRVPSYSR